MLLGVERIPIKPPYSVSELSTEAANKTNVNDYMHEKSWRTSDECHESFVTIPNNNMTSEMTQIDWLILERGVIRIHIVWI